MRFRPRSLCRACSGNRCLSFQHNWIAPLACESGGHSYLQQIIMVMFTELIIMVMFTELIIKVMFTELIIKVMFTELSMQGLFQ